MSGVCCHRSRFSKVKQISQEVSKETNCDFNLSMISNGGFSVLIAMIQNVMDLIHYLGIKETYHVARELRQIL